MFLASARPTFVGYACSAQTTSDTGTQLRTGIYVSYGAMVPGTSTSTGTLFHIFPAANLTNSGNVTHFTSDVIVESHF
jgi:hypothetical protein